MTNETRFELYGNIILYMQIQFCLTYVASAMRASNVSRPVGIIWFSGNKKPYLPVSRSSTPYEYSTPSLPYVQSALLPLDTSEKHTG